MEEHRVFGPPGTGKTTYVADRVRDSAQHRGTDRIVVGSFTRTAAAEIAGRGLPIPAHQIGTLHSLAYRAIGKTAVAEDKIDDWNTKHRDLAITPGASNIDEGITDVPSGGGQGDKFMRQIEELRARMVPVEEWPQVTRMIYGKWCEWKQEMDVIDFTDMIELALERTECAPGAPVVGFFDEFQDFTPLEIALVRKWGEAMERLVVAGDDDQCVYSFKGATPEAFLHPPVPDEQKRILTQSYRVPAAVHAVAQPWIERVTQRQPKDYEPRDAEGLVRISETITVAAVDILINEISGYLDAGQSVMVLTACSYMLEATLRALRVNGIPFHNPYRRSRGDWNPLGSGRGTSSAERLASYLVIDPDLFGDDAHPWTGVDLQSWVPMIRSQGVLVRGAKTTIEALTDPQQEVPWDTLEGLFTDSDELDAAVEPSMDWFKDHLLAAKRRPMSFPLKVAKHRGAPALLEEPRVTVGTIHSVKGGQADVVYLFGDLPNAAARFWTTRNTEGRDAILRQFYVGMTRARDELVLCNGMNAESIDWTSEVTI